MAATPESGPEPPGLKHLDLGLTWSLEAPFLRDGQRQRVRCTLEEGQLVELTEARGGADLSFDDDHLLCPGFLDMHVHCRDDPSGGERYKEDFASASAAALHGGVVAVGDMPNNPEPPVDATSYARKRAEADERALVDVMLYGAVTADRPPFSQDIPYKCYYGPSVGDLHFAAADHGEHPLARFRGHFVAFHAESHEILEASREARLHEDRRPPEAEIRAVEEILELARVHGFHPHIAHLSTAGGLDAIRRARASGLEVSTEVTPHHLFCDRENRTRLAHGDWLQMNPPLRSPEDRLALIEGLRQGDIDMIATDHAPHSLEENRRGISGVPHLDTFGAFLTWLESEHGFSWETLLDRAAAAPARVFARFLDGRFGTIEKGGVGSLTVLHTRSPWRVDARDIRTRAGWSPFEEVEFPGRVVLTVVRGRAYPIP